MVVVAMREGMVVVMMMMREGMVVVVVMMMREVIVVVVVAMMREVIVVIVIGAAAGCSPAIIQPLLPLTTFQSPRSLIYTHSLIHSLTH